MSERSLVRTAAGGVFLALALLLCGRAMPLAAAGDPKPASGDDKAFGPTKVWAVHLELSAREYDAMQPPFAGGVGPPPQEDEKKKEPKRDHREKTFRTHLPPGRAAHA